MIKIKKIPEVNTAKTLEFAYDTPEGNDFWPKLQAWRTKNDVLKATRASGLPTQSMTKRRREQMTAAQRAADELKDIAIDSLAIAYRMPDIREEYEPELLVLGRELGFTGRELDRYAVGPHRPARNEAPRAHP